LCYTDSTMCEKHEFVFDVDIAYADQLVTILEASPEHSLKAHEASRKIGIYVLYRAPGKRPTYVGQAVGPGGVSQRLNDHVKKIGNRNGISIKQMTCRYLYIRQRWEVSRAEEALIKKYSPEWNGIPGFSMHVPGKGRPGMPDYVNEWDKRFPPIHKK
jgi:hypothetical protein